MNAVPMKELETSRLRLRKLRIDDVYDYYEGLASDGEVMKYLPEDPHQDISESLTELERTLENYDRGACLRWAVADREEDGILGIIELTAQEDSCSVRCMLMERCWNQGYATEAMEAVIAFAREELAVGKLTAEHFAANTAAGALLEKLGMARTGVAAGKYEKQCRLHDAVQYELVLREEQPLTVREYAALAMTTLNPALSKSDALLNGVMGLCGESGEAIDLVKKHRFHGHALDRDALAKELGDVAWYLAETAYGLEIPLEEIFRMNLEKLRRRYPAGFDAERSKNR